MAAASAAPSSSAASGYTTPTKRPAFAATANADAGPSRARPSGSSPAYSSRRHSLYGVEDRVIIDPGSRIWRVGYSGEYDPRGVFWTSEDDGDDGDIGGWGLWELDLADTAGAKGDRAEAKRLVEGRILRLARDVYIRHLKTDPKTRKVIILESTFMPEHVKQALAKAFFDNLKVPSVAFTSASVLALAACGRSTGLVVDVGWLETTVTPVHLLHLHYDPPDLCAGYELSRAELTWQVFHSRPLYHSSRSTPLAGQALYRRLRALLLRFASYTLPPPTWSAPSPAPGPVPRAILTDRLIERIITEACFASDIIPEPWVGSAVAVDAAPADGIEPGIGADGLEEAMCASLKERYETRCDARDVHFNVPDQNAKDVGRLKVPGWVRERAAEILFGDDESEAAPLQHAILDTVAKLPVDLRPTMLSSILVTGGTACLPGFIPRLRDTLLHTLALSARPVLTADMQGEQQQQRYPITSSELRAAETRVWRHRHTRPYASLAPLSRRLVMLNDPCPLQLDVDARGSDEAGTERVREEPGASGSQGGKVPRWTPGLMSWVGGSLAGALKTGGPEITREEYDTRTAIDAERKAAYKAALQAEAEAEREAGALAAAKQEQDAHTDTGFIGSKPYSGRVVEGVQLEDLLPGMALVGASRRKRGWKGEMGLHDWSRALRT